MFWSRPDLCVLFVCTANICRSPLAEGLLRHRLRADGLAGRVAVRSAGTTAMPGLRPDSRAVQVAAEAGVPLGRIRSRRLTPKMLASSDYVLVMDRGQLEDIRTMGWDPAETHGEGSPGEYDEVPANLQLIGHFLPAAESGVTVPDIPDPYYSDLQGFRDVHYMLDRAVSQLMQRIVTQLTVDNRYL